MTIIIFSGPTLSAELGRTILDAKYFPPAAQGDIYRHSLAEPRAIGLIDGYFQSVASVWHKEILWAMSKGIHVFGSASMGALRAAELAPYGMVGHGRIFESYQDGLLEDDDEVAITHGPPELDYCPLSEALVNIRFSLMSAVEEDIISPETCQRLIEIGKALFYPERTYNRILDLGLGRGLPARQVGALRRWLVRGAIEQKREDALGMLRVMGAWSKTDPAPKKVTYQFEVTDAWRTMARAIDSE